MVNRVVDHGKKCQLSEKPRDRVILRKKQISLNKVEGDGSIKKKPASSRLLKWKRKIKRPVLFVEIEYKLLI